MQKSISRTISELAVNLKYNDLPKEVIHEVRKYCTILSAVLTAVIARRM